MRLLALILKNLARNKLRTGLTALSIFFLVAILTLIGTVLSFLQESMTEKEKDIKLIVTERSDMDSFSQRYMEDITRHDSQLHYLLRQIPGFEPEIYATWNFILFSLDKELKNKDTFFVAVATQPDRLLRFAEGLEDFAQAEQVVQWMKRPPKSGNDNIGIILGPERMKKLNKQVGDVFRAYVFDQNPGQGAGEFEFEIVGELPATSRWTTWCFMDMEYLQRQLRALKSPQEGRVDLGWLMVQNQEAATRVSHTISTYLPQLKCETLASAMNRFLDSYKDLLFGIKYFLVPSIYVVMALIVANAISITVRERRQEIAVLKVLGFRARQILFLILGEGVLLGILAGALGSWLMYTLVNILMGGVKIPIGFFPLFFVPREALWWGPMSGLAVALLGCLMPALAARRIKVMDVFSKVT